MVVKSSDLETVILLLAKNCKKLPENRKWEDSAADLYKKKKKMAKF